MFALAAGIPGRGEGKKLCLLVGQWLAEQAEKCRVCVWEERSVGFF